MGERRRHGECSLKREKLPNAIKRYRVPLIRSGGGSGSGVVECRFRNAEEQTDWHVEIHGIRSVVRRNVRTRRSRSCYPGTQLGIYHRLLSRWRALAVDDALHTRRKSTAPSHTRIWRKPRTNDVDV